jgi:hypothetical protein
MPDVLQILNSEVGLGRCEAGASVSPPCEALKGEIKRGFLRSETASPLAPWARSPWQGHKCTSSQPLSFAIQVTSSLSLVGRLPFLEFGDSGRVGGQFGSGQLVALQLTYFLYFVLRKDSGRRAEFVAREVKALTDSLRLKKI